MPKNEAVLGTDQPASEGGGTCVCFCITIDCTTLRCNVKLSHTPPSPPHLSRTAATSDQSDYPIIAAVAEEQSQVAAGPDTGSLVEQITYLTSWPQTSQEQVVEVTASYH